MSHVRQQIRDAVVTLLSADSPTEWNKAYNTRLPPQRCVLPYLLVYIDAEADEPITVHTPQLTLRDMVLTVLGHVRIPSDRETFEDTLDDLAVDVETRLTNTALNTALSNKLKGMALIGTTSAIVEDDNERTYAEIAFTWRIQVNTIEGDAETLT